MSARRRTFECPHCGADVVEGRAVCRECGSDPRTGWQDEEEIDYQGVDIPDGYGPADEPRAGVAGTLRRWLLVAIALIVATALLLLTVLRR